MVNPAEQAPQEDVAAAYSILAGLPEDRYLIDTIKEYSEDRETWIRARVATTHVEGLPEVVTQHWSKDILMEVSYDNQPDDPDISDIENIVRAAAHTELEPAYSLSLEAGIRTSSSHLASMWLKVVERSSGFAIHLRRPGHEFEEDFFLDDGFGGNLGMMTQENVTKFLASIANVEYDPNASRSHEERHQILLHNISEMFTETRRKSEFRLTAELGKASIENPANHYAGIVLVEDIEAKKGTNTAFILERLLDYPDFNTKVTRRLIAEYFDDCGPHRDEESEPEHTHTTAPHSKITLIKTIASDSKYTIADMSSSSRLKGDRKPDELAIEPGEGAAIQDILEQVVAAVSDQFFPREKTYPIEEQL